MRLTQEINSGWRLDTLEYLIFVPLSRFQARRSDELESGQSAAFPHVHKCSPHVLARKTGSQYRESYFPNLTCLIWSICVDTNRLATAAS